MLKIIKNLQCQVFNISTRVYFGITGKKTQNCANVLRKQLKMVLASYFIFNLEKFLNFILTPVIHYIHCKYSKLLMTLKRAYLGRKGFWEDGVVGSTRNPAFHPDTVTLAGFVWYNYFGTLKFTEDLILPGEALDIKLWLISVNFITFQLLIPTPKPNVWPLCTCSWSSLHTACQSQSDSKDPVLQISGIYVLVASWCFWS